jgi:hypothetical protein
MSRPIRFLWVFALGACHAPALLCIILFVLSLPRAEQTQIPLPRAAGTQWRWFRECIRVERWYEPIRATGTVTMNFSVGGRAGFVAWGPLGFTEGMSDSSMRIHSGHWYELRPMSGLLPTIVLSLAAMVFEITLWKRSRVRLGLCPDCGYDLRATPDRCPECGHEVAPSRS